MYIIFIRHAESEYNKAGLLTGRIDCNLTSKGIEDAKLLGTTLNINFDVVYCSPLKRTKQTLKAILPNCEPIYDNRIIERSFGILEGMKKIYTKKQITELYNNGSILGAESNNEIDKRVSSFVNEIFKKYHNNENILVITHGGVLNSIKRNFISDYNPISTNNLSIFKLTNNKK